MLGGQAEGDAAAHGVAEHVDLLVAEVVDWHGQVVSLGDVVDRAVTERGASMTVEIDRDHLSTLAESREDRPEHVSFRPAVTRPSRCPSRART